MNKIQKLLSVGDYVYSAANGQPLKVTRIFSTGFEAGGEYYSFDEHNVLYFLHESTYKWRVKHGRNKSIT